MLLRKIWPLPVFILLAAAQIGFLKLVEKRQTPDLTIAVLNNDRDGGGLELIGRLENAGVFAGVVRLDNFPQVKATLELGQAAAILIIPDDLTRNILSGKQSRIQLILDGRQSAAALISRGYALWVIEGFSAQIGGLNQRDDLITLVLRYWYEENQTSTLHSVPGVVSVLTLLTAIVWAFLFLPRKGGLGVLSTLLRGILPSLLLAVAQVGIVLLAAMSVFQILPEDNVMRLYWGMCVFSLSIISMVFAVYGVFKTRLRIIIVAAVLVLAAVILSGFLIPHDDTPRLLGYLASANPLLRLVAMLKGVLINDIGVQEMTSGIRAMLIITAAAIVPAVWFSRRVRGL